jgi:hypothetical protein
MDTFSDLLVTNALSWEALNSQIRLRDNYIGPLMGALQKFQEKAQIPRYSKYHENPSSGPQTSHLQQSARKEHSQKTPQRKSKTN